MAPPGAREGEGGVKTGNRPWYRRACVSFLPSSGKPKTEKRAHRGVVAFRRWRAAADDDGDDDDDDDDVLTLLQLMSLSCGDETGWGKKGEKNSVLIEEYKRGTYVRTYAQNNTRRT